MIETAAALEALFDLVEDDPTQVVSSATTLLEHSRSSGEAVIARWVRGMAHRQRNALSEGECDLRAARAAALELGDDHLAARIDVTLALVILYAEDAPSALRVLDEASTKLDGADLARLETQRGLVHHRVGRLDLAKREYERALARFADHPDGIGEIRVLNNLSILLAQRGELGRAETTASRSLALSDAHGQRLMAGAALLNRAYVHGRAGRTREAWSDLQRAEARYLELGRFDFVQIARVDLAEVLLRANLLGDALLVAIQAVRGLSDIGNPTDLADALLLLARCQLAAGRADDALVSARSSARLLRRQGRTSLLAYATFIRVFAASGRRGEMQPDELDELASQLRAHGWWLESTVTRVLAVDKFVRAGEVDRAQRLLAGFERLGSLPAAERSAVALARATVARARGDLRGARRAVTAGLRVVTENQAGFTDLESRAMAAGHSAVLRDLGSRLAIEAGRPRELLRRLESTRAGPAGAPRPSEGGVLDDLLTDLRAVAEELRVAGVSGRGDDQLRRRQLELEAVIRDRARRTGRTVADSDDDIAAAIRRLDDHVLVEYAALAGRWWAVSVVGGRTSLHDLGPTAALVDDVDACSFALHRLNRAGLSAASADAAWATLGAVGAELTERLVPDRVRSSGAPLVVVPDGVLHGVPWRSVLAPHRTVSVAPSLLGWAAADRASGRRPEPGGVAVLGGPDLPGAAQETKAVATVYGSGLVRHRADCDRRGLLDAMATADVVHLACHGRFRADNPMFSTLSMADGDVNVYDLQHCRHLPRTIVLSACSVGASSAVRGGTLLGLAAALMSFGVANVVAPLTPVNDEALVEVMVDLHRGLAAGGSPAAALAATAATPGTPAAAVSAAFVALGA